jgi:hypothetical protein
MIYKQSTWANGEIVVTPPEYVKVAVEHIKYYRGQKETIQVNHVFGVSTHGRRMTLLKSPLPSQFYSYSHFLPSSKEEFDEANMPNKQHSI